MSQSSRSARKKAIIVKLGQIGDVVMALPGVWALHQQGFEIDWVCGLAARPLLECYRWIRVIPVDDRAILRGTVGQKARGVVRLWSRVLAGRYDLCATLYYDRRFHVLSWPVRATRKVVLSRRSRATSLLDGRHHTDEYVRVLLGLEDGCREESTAPLRPEHLPPSSLPARTAARRIAIVPGGTNNVMGEQALRRWPVESYVAVAEQLAERGWEVVLLGGPEDAWVKPHFEHLTVTGCVGTLTLPEVISACDSCDAVITHDTGPLHLAGLSTACVIGIFGPTDPSTRVPRRPGVVGIWGGQGFACRPCYDGRNFAPCRFHGCMHQVGPGLVLRELDRALDARSRGVAKRWHIVAPGDL